MSRTALICALILLSLVLPACARGTQEAEIIVSYCDFIEELDVVRDIEVLQGSSFTVLLFANPESGFEWQEASVSDGSVLAQVKRTHRSQDGTPPTPALTPRQDIWTFQALTEGSSTVTMAYSQPRENGRKAVWTVTLHVTVR